MLAITLGTLAALAGVTLANSKPNIVLIRTWL